MSQVTVCDIPLVPESPAQRLRRLAAAVRIHFTWWGVHRTLTARQKEEVGVTCDADARLLTAGKKLVDTRHEAFRRLTALRTRIGQYWRGLTLKGRAFLFSTVLTEEAVMTTPLQPPRQATARDLYFFTHPQQWPT